MPERKGAFKDWALLSWNLLQNDLKLKELIPLTAFKSKMKELEGGSQKLSMFLNYQGHVTDLVFIFNYITKKCSSVDNYAF